MPSLQALISDPCAQPTPSQTILLDNNGGRGGGGFEAKWNSADFHSKWALEKSENILFFEDFVHFCVQAKPGRILCRPGIWDTFGRKKCEKAFSACFFPWDTRCGFLSFFSRILDGVAGGKREALQMCVLFWRLRGRWRENLAFLDIFKRNSGFCSPTVHRWEHQIKRGWNFHLSVISLEFLHINVFWEVSDFKCKSLLAFLFGEN